MKARSKCQIEGCSKPRKLNKDGSFSKRWCSMHASRLWQNGSLYAKVKPKHLDGQGYTRPDGYLVFSIDYKNVFAHRLAWEKYNGRIPEGYHIHHIDSNRQNNDITNLACLSQSDHIKLHRRLEHEFISA